MKTVIITQAACVLASVVGLICGEAAGADPARSAGAKQRTRRVLYNFDGSGCMYLKAGTQGPAAITVEDLKRAISEITYDGSQVDSVLVCINAQVMYYPTTVGTMIGTPPSVSESQLTKNLHSFFATGVDPYAIMLAETKRRGRESLLSFRVNDDHGKPAFTTQFWVDHPDCRLGRRALNFGCAEVRSYSCELVEEAVRRYECDGIELDFNRFPRFFGPEEGTAARISKMNALVERIHAILETVGGERDRDLILAVRVPSNFGQTPPTPETALELGCDVANWVRNGWVDFVTVSEFLLERGDLPLQQWKRAITEVPVYGGIEAVWQGRPKGARSLTAADYRRQAGGLESVGVEGVYIFNMFTSREKTLPTEPPFDVLGNLFADD